MRPRRPSTDHAEAVARRLALLSAELDAARRRADPDEDRPPHELTRISGSAVPFEEQLEPSVPPSLLGAAGAQAAVPPRAAVHAPAEAHAPAAVHSEPADLLPTGPARPPVQVPVPGRHAARRRGRPSGRIGGRTRDAARVPDFEERPSPEDAPPDDAGPDDAAPDDAASGTVHRGARLPRAWSRAEVGTWAPAQVSVLLAGVALALGVTCAWLLLGQEGPEVTSVAADGASSSVAPRSNGEAAAEPIAPSAPTTAPTVPGSSTGSADAEAGGQVVVHVAGKVRRPGIVVLPIGARVGEAVQKAGGAKRGADTTGINLARVLVDGEQVLVGLPASQQGASQQGASQQGAGQQGSGQQGAQGGSARGSASVPGAATSVSLNAADQALLETLPGVGPVTASAIVEWRTANGPFTAVEELLEVRGIGEATLARLAPLVTL